jgi:C-terminal processing protease CtpA/Prc
MNKMNKSNKYTSHARPRSWFGLVPILFFALLALACKSISDIAPSPSATPEPTLTSTPLPPVPVEPGNENPDEPVFITGNIPYTSPFFINTLDEPFVLLEDEAGAVRRDKDFTFRLESQAIGPVEVHRDNTITYSLALPGIPQGTQIDVDNDGKDEAGVQIFAIAYWSNIWDGPFLERRDGTGWSTAYVSTLTDPERNDEIIGGILVVWAPDDQQSFPTGLGLDASLFTEDDPTAPIPAGYNIVDLNEEPFRFYKEARPNVTLNEGDIAVNDFSKMSYADAFKAMVDKVEREYPFTREKRITWQALYNEYAPAVAQASNAKDFYKVLHDFTQQIPDGHVGVQVNGEAFLEAHGGGFGLVLTELSDRRVIVSKVFPGSPAENAGILPGAEILTWNGTPVYDAITMVEPYFGPYSTEHAQRLGQVLFLTHVPPNTQVTVSFVNPGGVAQEVSMQAKVEIQSLLAGVPELSKDELQVPVEGHVLDGSGLGYIRVNTFSEDYSLIAHLWDHFLKGIKDNKVPGLIIDLRSNSGGSGQLALNFAGYFFDEDFVLYQGLYYSEISKTFEASGLPAKIEPGPLYYEGPIAVLVSPNCISACEGFAYALHQGGRATIIGNYPTAGAFGEVGRGQYKLPGDITMQFPTGRHETPDGKLVIEGVGVVPDITVPVTEASALGQEDTLLDAAVKALQDKIK